MAAWLIAAMTGGCSGYGSDVDRRVSALLTESAQAVGGGATVPRGQAAAVSPERPGPDAWQATPASVNPPADAIRYDTLPESRSVEERLQRYAAALGLTTEGPAATDVRRLTLTDVLRQAHQTGREYLEAEERYVLAAISLLIERHQWGPRFFNDVRVALEGQAEEGDVRSALRVVNALRATQRLPYGGEVEASLVWAATEQLRHQATGRYRQSAELVLSGTIPLLRGAGMVARDELIQAERSLIYEARTFEDFRRQYLVDISRDYFDLVESRQLIENQRQVLASLEEILRGEEARYAAGRIAEFRKNIAADDVLRARAGLAAQIEAYILALDRFKIRLGLPPDQPIDLAPDVAELPLPDVTPDQAVEHALAYRLDLQNARDQVEDAKRALANARNAMLPDLTAAGRLSVPTDPDAREGGLALDPDELAYELSATLSLPIDRRVEAAALRSASIALRQRQRACDRLRDDIIVSVRQAVRAIDLARFQLRLAERQVEINERRVREVQLKADLVDTQTKVDATNALQQARNARDRARTALRVAILEYLLRSGQLRVARDGTFQPLPGMESPSTSPDSPSSAQ